MMLCESKALEINSYRILFQILVIVLFYKCLALSFFLNTTGAILFLFSCPVVSSSGHNKAKTNLLHGTSKIMNIAELLLY